MIVTGAAEQVLSDATFVQARLAARYIRPLGERGRLSNYVWEFVNRVAMEIAKTHPGKLISNCAYGIYTEPPSNIEKLEPNVQVIIVGGRRPTSDARDDIRQLRKDWAATSRHALMYL